MGFYFILLNLFHFFEFFLGFSPENMRRNENNRQFKVLAREGIDRKLAAALKQVAPLIHTTLNKSRFAPD